ncbi:hypothetical protein BTO02_10960 [Paraburkholderia sp. SOS3]|nr:hypothetical protein BTO02_10960 [Paraburkholderia sp. SOS3]
MFYSSILKTIRMQSHLDNNTFISLPNQVYYLGNPNYMAPIVRLYELVGDILFAHRYDTATIVMSLKQQKEVPHSIDLPNNTPFRIGKNKTVSRQKSLKIGWQIIRKR